MPEEGAKLVLLLLSVLGIGLCGAIVLHSVIEDHERTQIEEKFIQCLNDETDHCPDFTPHGKDVCFDAALVTCRNKLGGVPP